MLILDKGMIWRHASGTTGDGTALIIRSSRGGTDRRSVASVRNMGSKNGGESGKRDGIDIWTLGTPASAMGECWGDGGGGGCLSSDKGRNRHVCGRFWVIYVPLPRLWAKFEGARSVAR